MQFTNFLRLACRWKAAPPLDELDDCRPISHLSFNQLKYPGFDVPGVRQLCASVAAKEETLWLAKLAKSSHKATADDSSWFISGRSNCSVGFLLFFVICRRKRARAICVQRHMTWSSGRRRDQSMPIISPSISDQYLTSPVCHEPGSTICATRRPQSRWQPECSQKLSLSSSDMPARSSRWTLMLTCFHCSRASTHVGRGCRKGRGKCSLERRRDD